MPAFGKPEESNSSLFMAYGTIKADGILDSNGNTLDFTQVVTTEATTSAKGYMSAADKTKVDDIPTLSTVGRNETLTAASTTTNSGANTTVGQLTFNTFFTDTQLDPTDSDAEAFVSAIAGLSSGDSFTMNNQTYTLDGAPDSYSGSGAYDVTHTQNYSFDSGSITSGSVATTTYSVSITGSQNPIFDSSSAVTIDSVEYASGVWSVSGTGATATLNADPGIVTGDTLFQANALSFTHAGAATRIANYAETNLNTSNSLTLKREGGLNSLELTTGDQDASNDNNNIYLWDSTQSEPTDSSGVLPQRSVVIGSGATGTMDVASMTDSVFMGYQAGAGYTPRSSGRQSNSNTAIGSYAMQNLGGINTHNTAVGYAALQFSSSDGGNQFNTAVGSNVLKALTPGANWNTGLGYFAGSDLTSGDKNTLLGYQAGTSVSPSGTLTTQSNQICLGNNTVTHAYIKVSWTVTSDGRDKADITDLAEGLDFIKALRPVTYKWDERDKYLPEDEPENPDFVMPSVLDMTPDGTHKGTQTEVGFIAQEVEAVEKQFGWANTCDDALLTNCTEDHIRMGIKYDRLIPMMVNAIKELSDKNDALLARIEALES